MQEARDKIQKELAEELDSYTRVQGIERSIPFHKLRNLNIKVLIDIKNGNLGGTSNQQQIFKKSYEDLLNGDTRLLPLDTETISDIMVRSVDRGIEEYIIAALFNIPYHLFEEALENRGIIPQIKTSYSVNEYLKFAPLQNLKLRSLHFSSFINGLSDLNLCYSDITPDSVRVLKTRTIIDEEIALVPSIVMSSLPFTVKEGQLTKSKYFMMFAFYAQYEVFEESIGKIAANINMVIDFVTDHREYFDPLFEKRFNRIPAEWNDDDIYELFNYDLNGEFIAEEQAGEDSDQEDDYTTHQIGSGTVKILGPDKYSDLVVPNSTSFIDSCSPSLVNMAIDVMKYTNNEDDFETVYVFNESLNLKTEQESIIVFLVDGPTSVSLNGIELIATKGQAFVVSENYNQARGAPGIWLV